MKKILILLLLAFSGCAKSDYDYYVNVNPNNLKLKAGDKVSTTVSFYTNCEGTIVGHTRSYDSRESPTYIVSFYCPNIGWLEEEKYIQENSLKREEK